MAVLMRPQLQRTAHAVGHPVALIDGLMVYGVLKKTLGIRLDAEEEFNGTDLSIHRIFATPEREASW